MEVTQLVATVAAFLAPYIPLLMAGAEKLGTEAAKKFAGKAGEAGWEKAREMWQTLDGPASQNPKLKGASLALSGNPEDEDSLKLFSKALLECVEKDASLKAELTKLIGSDGKIQEVIARNNSVVQNVAQDLSGPGRQRVESDNSSVSGVTQIGRS